MYHFVNVLGVLHRRNSTGPLTGWATCKCTLVHLYRLQATLVVLQPICIAAACTLRDCVYRCVGLGWQCPLNELPDSSSRGVTVTFARNCIFSCTVAGKYRLKMSLVADWVSGKSPLDAEQRVVVFWGKPISIYQCIMWLLAR
jgi:hypothetical protein